MTSQKTFRFRNCTANEQATPTTSTVRVFWNHVPWLLVPVNPQSASGATISQTNTRKNKITYRNGVYGFLRPGSNRKFPSARGESQPGFERKPQKSLEIDRLRPARGINEDSSPIDPITIAQKTPLLTVTAKGEGIDQHDRTGRQ